MATLSMTSGSPWKHILVFSFPILAGAVLQQLYQTADSIIVGNLIDANALAAVGTTNSLTFFSLAAALGLSVGNGVLVSQYFGAGKEDRMRTAASTGIVLLSAMSVVLSILWILFARPACTYWLGAPEAILEDTVLYFRIYSAGLIFQFAYNIIAAVLRAVGDSAATLYFLLIASVMNVLLDLLFVGGFHWGVAGAALATDTAQAASLAAAWVYMQKKYPVFRFSMKELIWDTKEALATVKIGFPIALQMSVVAMGISFIQRAVNGFGEVMTASFAAGHRIEMFLHLPCNAMNTALATYTGQNAGAGKMERISSGAWQGTLLSVVFTMMLALPVWFWAEEAVLLFGLSDRSAEYCTAHLQSAACTNILLACYVPVFGVFQGVRRAVMPALIALAALSLRVFVTYSLKDGELFGHTIIWWNCLFGYGTGLIITWIYYLSGCWRKIKDL